MLLTRNWPDRPDTEDPPDAEDLLPGRRRGDRPRRPGRPRRPRRWAMAAVVVSAAVLVPWIAYLALTLPRATTAFHWPLAWSGLDGVIAVGLAATAWLAARGHRHVRPAAAATVALMGSDAWFDVCTSPSGYPLAWAVTDMIIEAGVASACLFLAWTVRPAGRS